MADKQVPLSIVIRTVDNATAGIQAINGRLDALTRPTRELGKAIGELGEKSGFNNVIDGFKGVGGALKDLLGKMLGIGAGVVGVGIALHGLVKEFDDLGDLAERLDVSVDFLAAMGFAAERSGSDIATLNEGMTAFGENMGQLRAGKGRMLAFLQATMPDLVRMLKLTKGNEAAWRLMADAMSKVTDPQKRLALAQKTVGNSALAPTLARGSKGLLELQGEFSGTAGSMEEAAEGAGKVDDALRNLKASTMGIKAAIITGLAPALEILVKKLTEWLSGHREDLKQWASDIGEKLPGAVDSVVKAITKAIGWVTSFVDGIGGIKTALVLLAAVMVGPTLAAFATLGIALATNPFGLVLVAVSALIAGLVLLIKNFDKVIEAHDKMRKALGGGTGVEDIDKIVAAPGGAEERRSRAGGAGTDDRSPIDAILRLGGLPTPADVRAHIKVDFANAPKGMRATTDPQSTGDVDLNVGYAFIGAGA